MNYAKNNFLKNSITEYKKLITQINLKELENFAKKVIKIKKNKKKILIFGNGAGAAISSHFASDLAKTLKIKALSFDNSAHITCFANDYKFENWILETLKVYADKDDLIILLSASGNSKNIINAAKFCKNKKINFFSLSGFNSKNLLNKNSRNKFHIESDKYNHIEVLQSIILLLTIDYVKNKTK